jgi:Tfp pilus assembly protein PilF/class 3 adenylate cyclase
VGSYFAAVFSDLERHSLAWSRVPRNAMVGIIAEYRYLAQSIASQYGRRHENFTGDGHLFLFEGADIAVHFGLKLIAFWKQRRRSLLASHSALELPLRLGCHFGECTPLADADAWVGRAINLAKQVEDSAAPDSLFVTQSVVDLIDLPFYQFEEAGSHRLKGDYLSQRQLYRIIAVDQAALAQRPDAELTAEDWFLKGVALVGGGRENSEEEAECYRRALALRPGYAEAHNNLAVLLKRRGDTDAAAHHYQQAIGEWPQYAEAHYNYAILLEELRETDAASQQYLNALHWRPDYPDAHHRYANLSVARGQTEEAQRHYQEALRLRPGDAEAHSNYAILLERIEQPDVAEQHYREALRLRPDYGEVHYNLAVFLEGQNRLDEAEQHYRAALRLRPDAPEVHNNLAALLHGKGELTEAEVHYAAALRLRPRDPETNYNFALLAQAKGDRETAETHFRLASELAAELDRSRSAIQHPD